MLGSIEYKNCGDVFSTNGDRTVYAKIVTTSPVLPTRDFDFFAEWRGAVYVRN